MHHFERWRANIVKANTRLEVLNVVRQYISSVLPSELSKLPQTSQSAVNDAATDIAGAAVTLLRDELRFSGDEDTAALMREMTQTFTAASARVAHLDNRAAYALGNPAPGE
jgi:hypothetical protein